MERHTEFGLQAVPMAAIMENMDKTTALQFLKTCMSTQLTALLFVVLGSSPFIVLYQYQGGDIGDALADIPVEIAFGAVVIFVPTFLYAAVVTWFGIRMIRHRQPAWRLYAVAAALTTIVFFGFVSLSSRPIPDRATSFQQKAPSVRRPALSSSELPLLIISIEAGLAGAWVCVRVLRRDFCRKGVRGD
jgi:hypothetical protein